MNNKHRRSLKALFAKPTRSDMAWRDVESLLRALECNLKEGRGSRIGAELNGEEAVFHKPHPGPAMSQGSVEAVRNFLVRAGVPNPWNT